MKLYDECFTGSEAVQWLHDHLQASGTFGTVSRQQVSVLLLYSIKSVQMWDHKIQSKASDVVEYMTRCR